jgi:hypothetical protein
MASKMRLGCIGANVGVTWAAPLPCPTLLASPDVALAVCTTRPVSVEDAR